MIKILTHFAHGVYQTTLSEIPGVQYYHVIDSTNTVFQPQESAKCIWDERSPRPNNVIGIEAVDVNPKDFDLMLIHWHPLIVPFCTRWGDIPTIFLEHTWPERNSTRDIFYWKTIRRKYVDYTVYITPASRDAWKASAPDKFSHIYHSIDCEKIPQKTYAKDNLIMTTTNEFIARDWACGFSLWANVLGLPTSPYFNIEQIALFGYGNENIGEVAKGPVDHADVLRLLKECASVYFNPSIMSPIPMSILEAAAVGVPIVSTAHCEVGNLFKNDIHGVITNDIVELRSGIKKVLQDQEYANSLARNARKLVIEKFSPDKFRKSWKTLFEILINN